MSENPIMVTPPNSETGCEAASPERKTKMEKAAKRICVLSPFHWSAGLGGAEYQIKLLIDHLVQEGGWDVHYLTRYVSDDWQSDEYCVHKLTANSDGYNSRYLLDTPTLMDSLDRLAPDVIYARVGCAYVGVAARYCARTECRLVWHVAAQDDVQPRSGTFLETIKQVVNLQFFDKQVLEYGLRRADHIVVQTPEQAHALQEHYNRSSTLIRNFHPLPAEVEQPKVDEKPVVVWIGNLKRIKQPGEYVKLARQFAEMPVRFLMIGANQLVGAESDTLMQQIEGLDNLEYLGPKSQDEVNELLTQAALLVNTSVSEGFSNTFIQAWMRGVPVLSLNSDPDNLLSSGRCGAYADGSTEQLAKSLRSLLEEPSTRAKISETAKDYALSNHGPGNMRLLEALFQG